MQLMHNFTYGDTSLPYYMPLLARKYGIDAKWEVESNSFFAEQHDTYKNAID